jgi:hypothetical protein
MRPFDQVMIYFAKYDFMTFAKFSSKGMDSFAHALLQGIEQFILNQAFRFKTPCNFKYHAQFSILSVSCFLLPSGISIKKKHALHRFLGEMGKKVLWVIGGGRINQFSDVPKMLLFSPLICAPHSLFSPLGPRRMECRTFCIAVLFTGKAEICIHMLIDR